MNTYLFYDIETTGLNKAFDQILRFAAVRTDVLFQETERHTIQVRLRSDVIPSPGAMVVNRIPIAEAMEGPSEYEAVLQIHGLMNEPGTTSLGYNSLGFDDEFIRFSFHRNLLPPYTHQYQNACHRMDLLPIAAVYQLYRKEVLKWPARNGMPTLKLEHLSAANGFEVGPAHDALADVLATVELARRLSTHQAMWNYLLGCFHKETDRSRAEELPLALAGSLGNCRKGVMISSEYGPERNYQVPVIYIGDSIPYQNQTLWLRLDLPELRRSSPASIPETSWVVRKRLGEPPILLPPYPRYWRLLGERQETAVENLGWLESQPDLFREIEQYHRAYSYPEIPDLDVDAVLYQMGFLSAREQDACRLFHEALPNERAKVLDRFPTDVTRALAERIICRNFPDLAPKKVKRNFAKYMQRVDPPSTEEALLDYRGEKRRTPASALDEINELRQTNLDQNQIELLEGLERFIRTEYP